MIEGVTDLGDGIFQGVKRIGGIYNPATLWRQLFEKVSLTVPEEYWGSGTIHFQDVSRSWTHLLAPFLENLLA
jgi:hypothetical protein